MKHITLSNWLRQLLNNCVNFEQICAFCAASARHPVCAACLNALPRPPSPACPHCAAPSPGALPCPRCLRRPPPFARLTSGWTLAFPLDALLYRCKYGHDLASVAALAELAVQGLSGRVAPVDAVIPMPLHPARQAQRGFNQSLEMVRPLARRLRIPVIDRQLLRIRDTSAQAGLTLAARRRNPRGAFAVDGRLDGRAIALFDDVVTSGATLSAATRALLHAGAARVDGWVLARTPGSSEADAESAYHQIDDDGENPSMTPLP